MLQGYIGILISEIRGHGMSVPLALYILVKDPPIQSHETKYVPIPPGPIVGWRFAPVLGWAWGLVPRQASF